MHVQMLACHIFLNYVFKCHDDYFFISVSVPEIDSKNEVNRAGTDTLVRPPLPQNTTVSKVHVSSACVHP